MSATPANGNVPPEPTTPREGGDARGRFARGNPGGPGNPFARRTARLRKVLLEVVTPEELRQVALTLLPARAGRLEAIKLLLRYALGKPAEMAEPEGVEVEDEGPPAGEAEESAGEDFEGGGAGPPRG